MKKNHTRNNNLNIRRSILENLSKTVTKTGGSASLKHPVLVFADDVCGQIPIVVRRIGKLPTAPEQSDIFDIGEGYTTDHLDNQDLEAIAKAF